MLKINATEKAPAISEVLYNSTEHKKLLRVVGKTPDDICILYSKEMGGNGYVVKPVMDTLCMTIPLETTKLKSHCNKLHLKWDFEVDDVCINKAIKWGKTVLDKYSKHAAYRLKFIVSLGNVQLLVQMKPTNKAHNYLRVTMQPSLMTNDTLNTLWSYFHHVSGGTITPELVRDKAKLTQIDWAIDYLNVHADELVLLKPGSNRNKRIFLSEDGKIETYYIQHSKEAGDHKHSKAYFYDKKKKPKEGNTYGGAKFPVTRMEFRTYPQHNTFSQFLKDDFSLKNQFEKHQVIDLMSRMEKIQWSESTKVKGEDDEPPHVWKLFIDHLRLRGMHNALKTIPDHLKGKYETILENQKKKTWNADLLWSITPEAVRKFLMIR